ncbi:MFS transporter [Nocardia sp. NPDC050406]|uniref:MFS transporter n=1 Tax=Nocardia sp. NPDC050406 TaxID=3364318 RepID=UPI0037AC8BB2
MTHPLRHNQFRRLFTAQVVALVGTGLLTVALGLLAFDIAGDRAGAVLGTALAIKMVAYVGGAPAISALTDRVPRRALLVSADAVRVLVAMLLPFVTQTWQVYVLIFVLQSASATFTPAFQSVIPSVLVDEEDYTRGLSLSRLAYDLESLLSPVVAAALLTVMSYNLLFVGTAAGFAVSAMLVLGTRLPPQPTPDRSQPLPRRITDGARVMLTHPPLRGLLALNVAVASASALVIVNTVVYVGDLLGGSATEVASALGCFGFGSMAVALAAPRALRAIGDRRLMLTGSRVLPLGLVAAAALAPLANWPLLALTWFALGAGTSMISTPSARLLRAHSTPDTRAPVFTAQFSLSHAAFLVTYPIAGWLGAFAGLFASAATLAVLATLAATTAARVWPASAPAGREVVSAER